MAVNKVDCSKLKERGQLLRYCENMTSPTSKFCEDEQRLLSHTRVDGIL